MEANCRFSMYRSYCRLLTHAPASSERLLRCTKEENGCVRCQSLGVCRAPPQVPPLVDLPNHLSVTVLDGHRARDEIYGSAHAVRRKRVGGEALRFPYLPQSFYRSQRRIFGPHRNKTTPDTSRTVMVNGRWFRRS